jgi:hypothetical protein
MAYSNYPKAVELETDNEKKTYKPSLEYLKEIGGVLGLFEKASSSSNQV